MSANIGFINGVFNSKMEKAGGHRLGISYAAGLFSVIGANGEALSDNNPGYVTVWSSTAGQLKTYSINAPQSFIDDAGASQIIGNRFGLTTGVAAAVDVPFFLYGCTNDAEDTLTFAISRIPHIKVAPAVGDLGDASTVTANTEYSMFLLDDVTLGDYDTNPVVLLGSFRMQMSTSDDWTVQALDDQDGIGRYNDSRIFTGIVEQFGAGAATYQVANGGTTAKFTTTEQVYQILPNGVCYCNTSLIGAGTNGAGSVVALTTVPFLVEDILPTFGGQLLGGCFFYRTGNASRYISVVGLADSHTAKYMRLETTSADYYEWGDFTAGGRQIVWSGFYRVRNA